VSLQLRKRARTTSGFRRRKVLDCASPLALWGATETTSAAAKAPERTGAVQNATQHSSKCSNYAWESGLILARARRTTNERSASRPGRPQPKVERVPAKSFATRITPQGWHRRTLIHLSIYPSTYATSHLILRACPPQGLARSSKTGTLTRCWTRLAVVPRNRSARNRCPWVLIATKSQPFCFTHLTISVTGSP
jgi:hypothetical protein